MLLLINSHISFFRLVNLLKHFYPSYFCPPFFRKMNKKTVNRYNYHNCDNDICSPCRPKLKSFSALGYRLIGNLFMLVALPKTGISNLRLFVNILLSFIFLLYLMIRIIQLKNGKKS